MHEVRCRQLNGIIGSCCGKNHLLIYSNIIIIVRMLNNNNIRNRKKYRQRSFNIRNHHNNIQRETIKNK